ncbi:helix-turn-helix transcriptional regulator [Cytophagales bacterium LB-30]|uniref:Helix-turn-helix transcriptional regulator n=1 Tax=Shiella aurantiaca TaxID=3058365 RepID=A0ABT8F2F0_9BACT|nr:helix-turn-helix transcriptional regulator [Shiella aurantiaca]MDN4164478.1 helix-turn-helix transcriptional regulator [Shiella aurantiaca]
MQKGSYLGELEELILLAAASLGENAYGLAIMEALNEKAKRNLSLSAVHTVLYRLEEKGLLRSEMGGATAERGGRRKRLFKMTQYGAQALQENREVRESFWSSISLQWQGGNL